MGQSAYVKLVKESTTTEVTLDDVREKLNTYMKRTYKTGVQLNWKYAEAAFPYEIIEQEQDGQHWLYLKGHDPQLYKYILVGVADNSKQHYIHIVLPQNSTHGDKNKANEYCKFLAAEYQAELTLFNGRTMYYYPRKP